MIYPLTSLRFFFALMVFGHHISMYINKTSSPLLYDFLYEGHIGVSFFFVLSGFVLAFNYQDKLEKGQTSKTDFWVARFARIYPLHLVTLIIAAPLAISYVTELPQWLNLLFQLSLTQSFIPIVTSYYSFNGVAWSISNEAFFYLLFPFFITTLSRKSFLLPVFLIAALLIPILPLFVQGTEWMFKINPVFRFIDFGLGILLFQLYRQFRRTITMHKGTILEITSVLFLLGFILFRNEVAEVFRYSSYYWLPMALVIFAFSFQKGMLSKLLSTRALIVLGEISFAFYMIHPLVIKYMNIIGKMTLPTLGTHPLLLLAITLIASFVLHTYIEKPANKFTKQLFKRKRAPTKQSLIPGTVLVAETKTLSPKSIL